MSGRVERLENPAGTAPRAVGRPVELVRVSRVASGLVGMPPKISENHPSSVRVGPMYDVRTGEGWRSGMEDRGGVEIGAGRCQ